MNGTGAALGRGGGDEREHRPAGREEGVDGVSEHRTARARTQALAMNDAHAAQLARERPLEEHTEPLRGRSHRESVQIDLGLDPVVSAPQVAQGGSRHGRCPGGVARCAKRGQAARTAVERVGTPCTRLGSPEASTGCRLCRAGLVTIMTERTYISRRLAKQGALRLGNDGVRPSLPRGSLTRYIGAPLRTGHGSSTFA